MSRLSFCQKPTKLKLLLWSTFQPQDNPLRMGNRLVKLQRCILIQTIKVSRKIFLTFAMLQTKVLNIFNNLWFLFVINFTCVFICIDVNSLACPQNIPLTVPNLGEEQGEEVGGETVEEVVETDQQIFFEMDLDEGNDAHLTSIIYWCSLFCYHSY